ncbi:putative integral membrane protein [Mycobacterium numidiamassiliense]|uniref:Putative integral membrane protein n=1 Tax=Mycobacterium numidiamassiliense TaxID=1841861 RepID=A0A2U3PC37_9MYCO|nr:GAP family protein [Mycobacterium numidiamassiliense]SPM41323.1 putative integral membrane protein [Mycobacterium numidiamassiliense]
MWITLLVMAVAISLEPFRIGMTVLMLNRPRPMLQLLAFLCGGFAMGMSVGLVVLFVVQRKLPNASHVSLPGLQMLLGALALITAAVLAVQVATKGRGGRRKAIGLERLSARARRLLHGRSLWVAGMAGLGIALPSVDYLAVLAVIVASGTAALTQVGALVIFHLVAFALVEIPLLAYVLAPEQTRTSMIALHNWIRSRRRIEVACLLATAGCVLLVVGSTSH